MPARLVYSPKVYAFTQQQSGAILDISKYIVSGQVDRKINQVSSASITLRNPQRRFTQPSTGMVAFHPMDPITIYLERIAGKPVRVFTGYLDTTPYYTLYPKTITLQASCTLKRLMYTYFDPSLPYTNAFFRKYGWYNLNDGTMWNLNAVTQKLNQTANKTQDTSLGQLLWAILYDIGQWQDSNIFIENLPTDIVQKVVNLATNLKKVEDVAVKEFETFLKNIIGDGVQGSGGGAGNPASTSGGGKVTVNWNGKPIGPFSKNQSGFASEFIAQTNLDPGVVLAWIHLEEPDGADKTVGYGIQDWLNVGITDSGPLGAGNAIWQDPVKAADATANWMKGTWSDPGFGHAASGIQAILKTVGKGPMAQIAAIRASGWATSGYPGFEGAYQTYSKYVSQITSPSDPSTARKSGRLGGALDAPTSGTNLSVGTNPLPPAQRGTKPLQTDTKQASRATQVGFGFGASNIFGDAVSAAANATVNQVQNVKSSRIDCMLKAANNIDTAKLPYVKGGGHPNVGTPSGNPAGYDCSGSVAAVLAAGNIIKPGTSVGADNSLIAQLEAAGMIQAGVGKGTPEVTLWDNPGVHIFMSLNGKYFGTWSGGSFSPTNGSGVGWSSGASTSGFTPYYIPARTLNEKTTYAGPAGAGTASSGGTSSDPSGGGTATDSAASNAFANAFVAQIEAPSLMDQVTATALGAAHMGLMHDQPLLPFVQQVAQASMRSFQSLPNGDFYAFYPDYFGEFGQHDPYWLIDDLEILDGEVSLSDDALATHVYAVGDTTWPISKGGDFAGQLMNMLQAGTIDIFSAFGDAKTLANTNNTDPVIDADTAVEFIKRYGPRPLVQQYPMVRSQYFEMFLAYQQFMLAWSTQFKTPFTFTFMPELYPGGKVAFPDHGLQMYIDSVSHSFDYTGGFTTTAELSAPSVYGSGSTLLPPNMVKMSEAIFEPIRQAKSKGNTEPTAVDKHMQQQVVSTLTETASDVENALNNLSHWMDSTNDPNTSRLYPDPAHPNTAIPR